MRRWAWITVALYLTMLVLMGWPIWWVAFGWGGQQVSTRDIFWDGWAVWCAWLVLMGLAQGLLLLVPIGTAERRPKARRSLWVPIVVTTVLLSALGCTIFALLLLIAWPDKGGSGTPFLGDYGAASFCVVAGFIVVAGWIFWGTLFNHYRKTTNPDALTSRLMRWLLVGSILELLVAVPSHIIVRQRGDCCAPLGTFFGMVAGFSVMLMAFGPGVYFLFAKRIDRLRHKSNLCLVCGYDLRASTRRCPECGTTFEDAAARQMGGVKKGAAS